MTISHVEALVIRVCKAINPEPELKAVAEKVRGSVEWLEFVHLLIDPDTLWTDVRPLDALAEIFDQKTMRAILPKHPDWVERVFGLKNVDAYWSKKIRYHIANGDLDRAYDEAIKASRGVQHPEQKMWNDPFYFRASPKCLIKLLRELAEAVGEERLESACNSRLADVRVDPLWGRVLRDLDLEDFDENFVPKKDSVYSKMDTLMRKLTKYFISRKKERRQARKERKLKEYEVGQK